MSVDGVELHAANGYLIDQFLQDKTNKRTDRYGGSVENRARFLLEIVDAVSNVWGVDRVGVHLRPRGEEHDMGDSNPKAAFGYVADALAYGRDYIATPDLAERLQRGLPLNTPNKDTFYGDGHEGYTDYPRLLPSR